MDFFYNAPDQVVDDTLAGLARIAPVRITARDAGIRIVVDREARRDRVAVISGGGAGHEPAHAGFVGQGMLTAAVAGDLFTSPSVTAVLAAIREVTGPAGCLLVVKNYTGDRLNFGLAAERARGEGYRVAVVIVADDVALPASVAARGLAGTVLVHKIAGYHAAAGADLDTVAAHAETASRGLASIGLALSSATLPGTARAPRQAELGLGIHNEPGVREVSPVDARDALGLVVSPLLAVAQERAAADVDWLLLVNNLGSCSPQEMGVILDAALEQLASLRIVAAVLPAPLMSSLNMHGFSLTLMPADAATMTALNAPVAAIGWPGVAEVGAIATFTADDHDSRAPGQGERDAEVAAAIERAVAALEAARKPLDDLDAAAGDGDTGTAFARGATSIAEALRADRLSTGTPAGLAGELGDLLARDMGGSSGVLLSILFTATGAALADGDDWPAALDAGMQRMQAYGGAALGDRTMLDALSPAVVALEKTGDPAAAARAARAGADATADMTQARAGRAAYVRADALTGVVDPGAEAIARVLEALAKRSN